MKTTQTQRSPQRSITQSLAPLQLLTLSCQLPEIPFLSGGGSPDQSLEQSLQDSGLLFVEEVVISEELVSITYQALPEESPEVMAAGWLNALLAAHEAEPGAETYQLLIQMNGAPYLEVRAQGLDLEGWAAGELSAEEFLGRLEVLDVRPLESRALAALEPLGLALDAVGLEGGLLAVSYWPEPAADQADLMGEWWLIFEALAELGEEVEAVEIASILTDGSVIRVRGGSAGLAAYLAGEITALEFLAGLEAVVEAYNE